MLTRAMSNLQRNPLKLYQIRSVKAIVVFMTVLNSDYLSIDSYEQEIRKFVFENKTEIRKPLHEWLPGGGHNSPNFAWPGLYCTVKFVEKCFLMTELVS